MLVSELVLRLGRASKRFDGRRRRVWWFMFDPKLKEVFYRKFERMGPRIWLSDVTLHTINMGEDDEAIVRCCLHNGRFIGYIEYEYRPWSLAKASYDLKVNKNFLIGLPRGCAYDTHCAVLEGLKPVVPKTLYEDEETNYLNLLYNKIHSGLGDGCMNAKSVLGLVLSFVEQHDRELCAPF